MAVPTALTIGESRRFSVDEIIRMSDGGILPPGERLELVDGRLVVMSPEGVDHANSIARIHGALSRASPEGFQVRSQSGLPLGTHDYVEPDVFVIGRRPDWGAWPTQEEIILIVEVAPSSIRRDTGPKLEACAVWGVPEYWILDMTRGQILVHRDPVGDHFTTVTTVGGGPLTLPGLDMTIDADDVIPPAGKPGP
jgi:Uma2 family endonuclease